MTSGANKHTRAQQSPNCWHTYRMQHTILKPSHFFMFTLVISYIILCFINTHTFNHCTITSLNTTPALHNQSKSFQICLQVCFYDVRRTLILYYTPNAIYTYNISNSQKDYSQYYNSTASPGPQLTLQAQAGIHPQT